MVVLLRLISSLNDHVWCLLNIQHIKMKCHIKTSCWRCMYFLCRCDRCIWIDLNGNRNEIFQENQNEEKNEIMKLIWWSWVALCAIMNVNFKFKVREHTQVLTRGSKLIELNRNVYDIFCPNKVNFLSSTKTMCKRDGQRVRVRGRDGRKIVDKVNCVNQQQHFLYRCDSLAHTHYLHINLYACLFFIPPFKYLQWV